MQKLLDEGEDNGDKDSDGLFLDTFSKHSYENIAKILETDDETTPTTDTLSNMMLGKLNEKKR